MSPAGFLFVQRHYLRLGHCAALQGHSIVPRRAFWGYFVLGCLRAGRTDYLFLGVESHSGHQLADHRDGKRWADTDQR